MAESAEKILGDIKNLVENLKEEHGKMSALLNAKADNDNFKLLKQELEATASNVISLTNRLIEAEQKMADGVMAGKTAPKTLGQVIIATDVFKEFASGKSAKVSIPVQANTLTGQEGSPPRNSDTLVAPDRLSGIIPGAFRSLRVRDLLPSARTASNAIFYSKELAFVNNAAETAEGDTKPQSILTFTDATANVQTIAHWIKASKQLLDDATALAGYIDARMRYGVDFRIDSQLLLGNGTGQNIQGLLVGNNYTSFSPTAGETALDTLNKMKYAVVGSDYQASGILLNPADWGAIERIKGDDDHYVVGNPLSPFGPFLWGLPVVVSNNMPQGKALVAAFNMYAQVFDREDTTVQMFEQDDTNVQKNLFTIRAEARLALAVYLPPASRFGALTSPGASA